VIIDFEHVTKRYRLGAQSASLRSAFAGLLARRQPDALAQAGWLNALQDVSFSVKRGETLGIVGHNGAGKTTILRLLSRITRPSAGRVSVAGRVSSLIELGAGFHPELTGRENVFLNGQILGMSRRELAARYAEIVEFAELAPFMDMPVKRYSSGMYARLAFAVAVHVDPDVLLVDEVLAVGDEAFQLKCFAFMQSFVKGGRTSLFVSHNAAAIELLSDRVMWLDHGQVAMLGPADQVLRAYMDDTDRRLAEAGAQGSANGAADGTEEPAGGALTICDLQLLDGQGQARTAFAGGEDIVVRLRYRAERRIARPYFCIWISEGRSGAPLFAANMLLDQYSLPYLETEGTLSCRFRAVPLMPKAYNVWVEVYGEDQTSILYKWRMLGGFRILDRSPAPAGPAVRGSVRFTRSHGVIEVPYEWSS
jgi:lipopolysaccharide transport system ATP-binding protein